MEPASLDNPAKVKFRIWVNILSDIFFHIVGMVALISLAYIITQIFFALVFETPPSNYRIIKIINENETPSTILTSILTIISSYYIWKRQEKNKLMYNIGYEIANSFYNIEHSINIIKPHLEYLEENFKTIEREFLENSLFTYSIFRLNAQDILRNKEIINQSISNLYRTIKLHNSHLASTNVFKEFIKLLNTVSDINTQLVNITSNIDGDITLNCRTLIEYTKIEKIKSINNLINENMFYISTRSSIISQILMNFMNIRSLNSTRIAMRLLLCNKKTLDDIIAGKTNNPDRFTSSFEKIFK